jgi:hypothetical protein
MQDSQFWENYTTLGLRPASRLSRRHSFLLVPAARLTSAPANTKDFAGFGAEIFQYWNQLQLGAKGFRLPRRDP